MNYKGIELESCQGVIQEKQNGVWVDFATIKDASDCHYAELMVDGNHLEFKGQFRVMARIHFDQSKVTDISKGWYYADQKMANMGYGSSEVLRKRR